MIRAAILALLTAGTAHAQGIEAGEAVVEVVEAGVYCTVDTGEQREAPGTVAGHINLVRDVELRASTFVVPVAEGLTFGFRVQAAEPLGELTSIIHHPPFRGLGVTEQVTDETVNDDGGWMGLYTFDRSYEMVSGSWVFETRRNGETVLRVTFEAVPPAEAPQFVGLCSGPPKISLAPDPRGTAGTPPFAAALGLRSAPATRLFARRRNGPRLATPSSRPRPLGATPSRHGGSG